MRVYGKPCVPELPRSCTPVIYHHEPNKWSSMTPHRGMLEQQQQVRVREIFATLDLLLLFLLRGQSLSGFSSLMSRSAGVVVVGGAAVLLRAALVLASALLGVSDVDYDVYSDAALLLLRGASPYLRDTFRYPPLLALLLAPNVVLPSFGKV